MAIKTSGSEYLARTANLPPIASTTICAWFKHTADPVSGTWEALFGMGNTSGTPRAIMGYVAITGVYNWGIYNGGAVVGAHFVTQPKGGEWWFAALTNDGTTLRGYVRKAVVPVFENIFTTGITGTANSIRAGNSVFDATDFFKGAIAHVRAWGRALTANELLAESYSDKPVYWNKLNFAWPLHSVQDVKRDLGPNVRPATVTGTLANDKTRSDVIYWRNRSRLTRRWNTALAAGGAVFHDAWDVKTPIYLSLPGAVASGLTPNELINP
jgi:hypothetical protein